MNKKYIFMTLLIALPLLFTSCLKDQEDLFDDSASGRTAKYLNNVRRVLTSAENGWVLDYFPDRDQSYGGYSYTMKFDDENVKICWELADDVTESITSTYILNNEDGPVLMFDTYNEFMHYFATPSGSSGAGGYEAFDGDFIFIVMNISEDENTITLKGNRSGNIMKMHKLSTGIEDYQVALAEFTDQLVFDKAAGVINGQNDTLLLYAKRWIEIQTPDSLIEAPFCFDVDGFTLYEPITIGDKTVQTFKYNADQGSFTAQEAADVVFKGLLLPSIAINNIGQSITTGYDAATFEYTFNLADKFTYESNVDWVTVSVNGNTVTVNVAANNTGSPRAGIITVSVGDESEVIVVSQLDVVSLSGTFVMSALDSENAPFNATATINRVSGNDYTLEFSYYGDKQTIAMTWNQDEYRFEIQSGQPLGKIRSYYSFLCFIDGGFNYWTSTSTGYTGYLIPSLKADGTILLTLGGTFSSYDIGGFAILVGNDPNIENMLGYYEAFMNISFTK